MCFQTERKAVLPSRNPFDCGLRDPLPPGIDLCRAIQPPARDPPVQQLPERELNPATDGDVAHCALAKHLTSHMPDYQQPDNPGDGVGTQRSLKLQRPATTAHMLR